MNGYLEQIVAAMEAAVIQSRGSFSWFGRLVIVVPSPLRRALPPERLRAALVYSLRDTLYREFYQPGWPVPARRLTAAPPGSEPSSFAQALAAANAGAGTWESGWEVREVTSQAVTLRRDGLELWVDPGELRADGGREPVVGSMARLRLPNGLPDISPGFYTALSDEPFPAMPAGPRLRVYWNVSPAGAAPLVAALTTHLNRERLPFRLKILDNPTAYARADSAVLYLPTRDWPDVAPLLASIQHEHAATLRPAVPALTLELAPGLGLAEDPGDGESFGMLRCRLLAEGIVQAWERRRRSSEVRLLVVAECFAEAGVSFESPFLNPGSNAAYSFVPHVASIPRSRRSGPRAPLDVAAGIGRRIVERSIWSGERCTWLGARPIAPDAPPMALTWESLGADLYGGTAGVGLLLAELHRHTGDPATRRTALGALRQATATANTLAPLTRLGLYTGLPGIALACARAGRLLNDDASLDAARALLDEPGWAISSAPHEHDLLSGSAGAIAALLILRDLLPDPRLVDLAVELGERLLGEARASEHGLSWGEAARPAAPHLTGLSHGASGIGFALLELGDATGDTRFRDAGLSAFAWERQWFDPQAGNWPDFRAVRLRAGRPPRLTPQATFWCHGAPGIALARLRAWQLTGDEHLLAEAHSALATTRGVLERELRPATLDFSLCHGLAGLAGVLLDAAAVLPDTDVSPALATAELGTRLHAAPGGAWPCGTHTAETPGLMLGLAGIACFYLRLHEPALSSLLLPTVGNT